MHSHIGTWWIDDVPIPVVCSMVERICDVDLTQPVGAAVNHTADITSPVRQMESVRAAVLVTYPVEISPTNGPIGVVMEFDEVIWVRFHVEPDSVPLEAGGKLLDGAIPRSLAFPGTIGITRELGGDLMHIQLVGQLQQTSPVAHLVASLGLIGARP